MDLGLFLNGAVIGLSIAAPVGPIGVLVIRRTLAEGRLTGFVTGLGAATADAIYGAIGALGLALVASALSGASIWLRLLGGLFLCYLGLRTFRAPPSDRAAATSGADRARAYAATLLLTLTNPATILSFAAIFAGLGVGSARGDLSAALVLVAGVFCGSALWWLLLSGGVSLARAKLTPRELSWVNRVSGAIIAGFGVAALLSLRLG
jgi:threonine/homoserine/homoserine lactone efflux protein